MIDPVKQADQLEISVDAYADDGSLQQRSVTNLASLLTRDAITSILVAHAHRESIRLLKDNPEAAHVDVRIGFTGKGSTFVQYRPRTATVLKAPSWSRLTRPMRAVLGRIL